MAFQNCSGRRKSTAAGVKLCGPREKKRTTGGPDIASHVCDPIVDLRQAWARTQMNAYAKGR
jgi:hypothetical protein